jgi:hypothetical protein
VTQVEPDVCCKVCGGALIRCHGQHLHDPDLPVGADRIGPYHLIHRHPRDHDAEPIPLMEYRPPVDPTWEAKQAADAEAALVRFHRLQREQ